MTGRHIDLNADLGEGFGAYAIGNDDEMLSLVTSANIACGIHAGDPDTMARTVHAAAARGVAIGAHPGLPDKEGFGRRKMQMTAPEVRNLLLSQVGALYGIASASGAVLRHVKPHGALYWMAEDDPAVAQAIADAVSDFDSNLVLYGLSEGGLVRAGRTAGLRVAHEVFADRGYLGDGSLVPRGQPGDVIADPEIVVQRMMELVRTGRIRAVDGALVTPAADTICIHGDTPGAAQMAQKLRAALDNSGISLCAPAGQ